MNSAVITKIEHRIFPEANFVQLEIIPHSGKLSSPFQKNSSGNSYYNTTVTFNIAKSEPAKDAILKNIVSRKGQYRITDANGVVYLVGSETYPARLTYTRAIDGTPGSFNGYRCVITCQSVSGCEVSQ
jgi:hypothetical protein